MNLYPNLGQQPYPPRDFTYDKALFHDLNTVMQDVALHVTTPQVEAVPLYTPHHCCQPIVINRGPSWTELLFWSTLFSRQNQTTVIVQQGPQHHLAQQEKRDYETALMVVGIALGVFAVAVGWCLGKDLTTYQNARQMQEDLAKLQTDHTFSYIGRDRVVEGAMQRFMLDAKNLSDLVAHNSLVPIVMKVVAIAAALIAVVGCFTAAPVVVGVGCFVLLVDIVAYGIFAGMTSDETRKINVGYGSLGAQANGINALMFNYLRVQPDYQ